MDLKLADLPVDLSPQLRPAMGKHLRQDGQQMIPPLADLVRVDAEVRSDLGDRLLSLTASRATLALNAAS
jgi:hypothetical protein